VTLPAAGKYFLTANIAFKGFGNDPWIVPGRVRFVVQQPILLEEDAGGDRIDFTEFDSGTVGIWYPGVASEWSEDGVDPWRCDIPVTVPASNNAGIRVMDVRLIYDLHSSPGTASAYLDPVIQYRATT
jgi:hypothetical protein